MIISEPEEAIRRKRVAQQTGARYTPKIRARVAENQATAQILLQELSSDSNEEVRIAVGCNPSTPLRVILKLAFDAHLDVRYSLAEKCQSRFADSIVFGK